MKCNCFMFMVFATRRKKKELLSVSLDVYDMNVRLMPRFARFANKNRVIIVYNRE